MRKILIASRLLVIPVVLALLVIGPSIRGDSGANHQVRNQHFGVSGGNVNDISRRFCCSGTLGSLVTDGTTQYILSNNHVLARTDQAAAGEDISQPGLIDSNCGVATVVADFTTKVKLGNNVDCALAQLRAGQMDSTGFIEDIGTISSVVKAPTVGLAVAKSGRTTGFKTASISSVTTSVSVRYSKSCGSNNGPIFSYTNQVVINSTTFSAGGDSGSLIVSNNACHQPVALLYAGSSSSTIGNPIGEVLNKLGVALGRPISFVGGSTCTAAAATLQDQGLEVPEEEIARVSDIKDRAESRLFSQPSVIGVGVGALESNAKQAVIMVYIDQTTGISPHLPRRIEGVRVKKVYTDPFVAY